MQLADRPWTDLRDADTDLACLPVGSTEQHGPHAPLGTDATTATAVAEVGAAAYEDAHDRPVVVCPTVPVGVAEEHRDFAGTLWVAPETFRAYVRDVVRSLASHGFDRVVVVNGHGGNVGALREVCARVSRDGDAFAVAFTWFDAVAVDEMGHGGPAETAFVRHLTPDLVDDDRLAEAAAGAADRWGEWVRGVNLAHDAAEFTESGVVGDPRDAPAGLGEELLAESAAALCDVLEAVSARSLDG